MPRRREDGLARHDDAHTRYRQRILAGVLFAGIGVFDSAPRRHPRVHRNQNV